MGKTRKQMVEEAQARGLDLGDVTEENSVEEIEQAIASAEAGPIVHEDVDTSPRESEPLEEQPDVESLKDDDQVNAVVGDAEPHDPPVRTTLPDVPVIGSLAVGAGQHQPTDAEEYDESGRPRAEPSTAFVD